MKQRKVKIKKNKQEKKEMRRRADMMKPKKVSMFTFAFIGITALAFLIVGYFVFGTLVAVPFTVLYLLLVLLVQVIDRYPVGSKKRRRAKAGFLFILLMGILGVLAFIAFFTAVILSAPEFDTTKLERNETTIVYDSKKNIVATLGTEKREKLEYDELPNVLVDAIVATEDSRFFQHNGVDAPRFIKAVIGQLAGASDAGGGSTLTMQVAKNNFTSREAEGIQGIIRKFTDIYLSIFKIERAFTKQEIIEFYVNEPFLGSNSYGVEQAAQTYFGKHAKQMNLSEAALIAGLFQAPGAYDPYLDSEAATQRRSTVLSLMVRHGYITEEEKEIAEAIPVKRLLAKDGNSTTNKYQGYIDLVIQELINKTGMDPYAVPMEVFTNLDPKRQQAIEKVFSGKTHTWVNSSIQGAAIAVDSHTGKILAVGAGRNRTGERTFNYATDISRQIGSTAKPIFDYGPAIEYNYYSTAHIFNDHPIYYSGTSQRIVNYDGAYRGNITLRYSLMDSRNVPAVLAFQSVDMQKKIDFATGLGIKPELCASGYEYDTSSKKCVNKKNSSKTDYPYLHQAHALGAFNGASPLQMAGAYTAFSNGGTYYEPYTVSKIILRNSNEKIEFKPEGERAMSDATAYMVTDVLKGVASHNGISVYTNSPYAMKTGTTNYDTQTAYRWGYSSDAAPDGWIVGYTPDTVIAMWTGYVENKYGRYLTMSQMFNHRNYLFSSCSKALFDNNGSRWTKPSSVVSVKVVKGTEQLPSAATPSSMIITELFRRGHTPKTVTKKYDTLPNPSNLRLSYSSGSVRLSWGAAAKPKESDKSFGAFGYNVYLNGKLLGFTTGTSYTYSGASPFGTYTVKTAYKNTTSNMSSGISKSLSQRISIKSNVDSEITIAVGDPAPIDSHPFTVYENGVDVTASATITHSVSGPDGCTDFSKPGTYTITYKVKYDGESSTATTKVYVEGNDEPETPPETTP